MKDGAYFLEKAGKLEAAETVRELPRSRLPNPSKPMRAVEGPSVAESLSAEIRSRRTQRSEERISFFDWSMKVPEPKTGPLDFRRFPFQLELYRESASDRELVVSKSTQVGISAWLLRWTMYWADMRGLTALYVFPKLKQMYDFCMAGDEQVLMADGTLCEIRDVREGNRVLSSDGHRVVEDTVTAAWCSGIRKLIRIELEGGREIRCTREHRVYTRRGWLRAGELEVGEQVRSFRTLPEVEGELSEDDAFLLALWLAEGSKTRAGYTVTVGDEAVRARAREIAAERGWDVYEKGYLLALTAKWRKSEDTPAAFLRRFGVRGMRTNTVRVPELVMRASRVVQEEFWRTYVACDGHVGPREITVASASERMARDLQVLAARLGMPGTVRSLQPRYPGAMRAWTFAVAEAGARAMARGIGAYSKCAASATTRAAVDVVAEGELGWSKVRAIEEDGEEETYDLETERHAFFVEGGLVHNSDARIRAAILKSEYLQGRIPPSSVQNKGLKAVGGGFVYFRGSESEDDLDSVDADVLSLDEYNRLTPANIPVAERRISGSRLGLLRRVGVPTIPGFGISRLYDRTDRRRWTVKCRAGHEQVMNWVDNVDEEKKLRVCSKCRIELRPQDVAAGRWVAERPDEEIRGYAIPKLIVPEVDMDALVERSRRHLPEERMAFWNRDMAEPYAPAEGRLSPQAIAAAQSAGERAGIRCDPIASDRMHGTGVPGYSGTNPVTMGIDVAARRSLNVRVSEVWPDGRRACLFVGEVYDFEEAAAMMDRYSVRMCVVDHMPEHRMARSLAERFPGRVYLLRYATTAMHRVMNVDEDNRFVSVRRTEAIDACFEMIRSQRNLLPPEVPEGYASQMMAPVRVVEKDEQGRIKVRYESPEADDYAHAEVYDLVAWELWRYRVDVDYNSEEYYSRLEDHMEFERSALHSEDDAVYVGGLESDMRYVEGFDGGSGD